MNEVVAGRKTRNVGPETMGSGTNTEPLSRITIVAGIGAAAYFLVHCVAVMAGSEHTVMAWLYDDAFYYLIVAKHFSETRMSSFDGLTLTTGYHPLWMWMCAVVYGIHRHLDLTYVRLCMGLSTALTTAVLVVALLTSLRRRAAGAVWAIALAATAYSALNNGLTVMEWPLVLLFWAALYWHLTQSPAFAGEGFSGEPKARSYWPALVVAFGLGVGGSLSRTDFGLVPLAYLAGGLLVQRRFGDRRRATGAFAALLGAAAGVGLVFLYNRALTGSWLQQSAEVKHRFASLTAPVNPVPVLWQFARTLLYLPPLDIDPQRRTLFVKMGLALLVFVCLPVAYLLVRHRQALTATWRRVVLSDAGEMFQVTSAALGVLGYVCVYSLNSQATYGWYTGAVTGFLLVLLARLLSLTPGRWRAALVLLLMACNLIGARGGGNARAQFAENAAGKMMHHAHPEARMGGGDVGKPSFYNDGRMINVDGLMNNEVVPYLLEGNFPCYVLYRHIEYLSDVGSITEPLVDAVRRKKNEPPVPWDTYFHVVSGRDSEGDSAQYLKTDFDAIRGSGECAGGLR